MKNIKIISLCLLLFLITGCTSTYDITIKDGKFIEEVNLVIPKDDYTYFPENDSLNYFIKNNTYAYDSGMSHEKYYKKVEEKTDSYHVNLKYIHDPNNFEKSKAISFFKYHAYIQTEDSYFIKMTGGINTTILPAIPPTTIRIITDNRVLQHNADSVEGNVYTWNINQSNGKEKELLFQVSKQTKEIVSKKGNIAATGVIAILGIVLFTALFWFLGKKIISAKV